SISAAMAKTTDHETRAHLEASRDEIAKILDPKFAPPATPAATGGFGGRGGFDRYVKTNWPRMNMDKHG
ncbi:MAG TPA: hypothetical protein VGK90_02120, partial [Rhizomicrobium sp.]